MKARTRTTQDWQTEAIYKLLAKVYRQAIAEATGVSIQPVKDTLSDFSEGVPKNLKVQSLFNDTDFTPPLYNIWTFAKKSNVAAKKCDTALSVKIAVEKDNTMKNERTKVASEILGHLKALSAAFLELQRVETETAVAAGCALGDAVTGAQQFAQVARDYETQFQTWENTFPLHGIKLS